MAVAGYLALSTSLLLSDTVRYLLVLPHDWAIFEQLGERLADGRLYDLGDGYSWVWSPLAAWLMASVIVPLGYSLWFGLHLASLVVLRDWVLIGAAVLSVPFWIDTIIGNSVVFVFVAGALATRGSYVGSLAYLALCLLVPRPVQAPLAAWLLWRSPELRIPFAIMSATTFGTAIVSGHAAGWLSALVPWASSNYSNPANFGPTAVLGAAWFVVGIPTAVWLTTIGRTGIAGLLISPYLLPQYFLLLLWELPTPGRARKRTLGGSRRERHASTSQHVGPSLIP